MPAWLPSCLKHCLVRERHHKVLRRLLHLLAAVPTNPPCSQPDSQPISNGTDSPRQQLGKFPIARQGTSGKAHNTTFASHAAWPDTATQATDATAQLPSLSAPVVPSPSSSTTDPQSPETATAASRTAATSTALQHCEQIGSMVTQACQPSVKRESLHCLGAAVHSVVSALMPSGAQQQGSQQDSYHQSQQPLSQSASASVTGGDQTADSHHLSQPPQELGQTATDGAQHEQTSKGKSGSDEAQLGSSLLHEAESRYSGLDLNTARPRDSATSQCPAQMSGRAEFEHRAADAQQAQREDEQTAYDLVEGFVALVSMHSEAQQFDDLRLAAATALAASGSHSTYLNTRMSPCWCGSEAGAVILDRMSVACMSQLSSCAYAYTAHMLGLMHPWHYMNSMQTI